MTKEQEQHNPCSVCGGQVEEKKIDYTQELDGELYLVREVPAEVCSQCAEPYLTPETVDRLQELIERGEDKSQAPESTIVVPVYHFPV
jgi:YgiT-type zinc finger domain-containing protein